MLRDILKILVKIGMSKNLQGISSGSVLQLRLKTVIILLLYYLLETIRTDGHDRDINLGT